MLRPIISIYFVCASQGISTSFPGTLGTRLKVSKGGLRYGNKSKPSVKLFSGNVFLQNVDAKYYVMFL